MPSATGSDEDEDPIMVPCIHVLLPPTPAFAIPTRALADPASTRTKLLKHLASSFSPLDRLAAEYLLLLLLSSPTVRPTSLPPLGTISINFLAPSTSRRILESSLRSLMPMVVDLPLSIPLLHSTKFQPHSPDSTKLNAGRLQLGHGTVIMIEEDAMGEGGKLEEKAVKNLKALSDCMTTQTLGYEYPYMDSLRMKCCLRPLVLSEGKSLLPVGSPRGFGTLAECSNRWTCICPSYQHPKLPQNPPSPQSKTSRITGPTSLNTPHQSTLPS